LGLRAGALAQKRRHYDRRCTDLAAAQVSKAWPFEEARKLIKRYPQNKPGGAPVLFETGYGPSGLPHIGTFRKCCARRWCAAPMRR
jgi:hypothetical protein